VTVSWFEPQNQVGDGLSVAPQNRQENATAGGARGTISEVALRSS
jgi:hypothetical protein